MLRLSLGEVGWLFQLRLMTPIAAECEERRDDM